MLAKDPNHCITQEEDARSIVTHNLDNSIDIQPTANELVYRFISDIPVAISLVITYIMEYIFTVINLVYGPIRHRLGFSSSMPGETNRLITTPQQNDNKSMNILY